MRQLMVPNLRNEILKTFLKWRTYIGFVAILVLVPVVQLGLKLNEAGWTKSLLRGLEADFFLIGNLFNGYLVTYFIMNSLWVHVPFLISLVAGDQLAGESTAGTFRLILILPVSRMKVLIMKYFTALFYTATLVAFLVGLSIVLGVSMFGGGDLLVAGRELTIIPRDEVLSRMMLACGLAIWSMWCVASLAILFSSLVENAIGPIVGSMTVIIVFYVLSNIPVDLFKDIRPFLFTTYLNVWQEAFRASLQWDAIVSSVLRLGGFSAGFFMITWYLFVKKDVLS